MSKKDKRKRKKKPTRGPDPLDKLKKLSVEMVAKKEWEEIGKTLAPVLMEGQSYSDDLMDKYVYPMLESEDAPALSMQITLMGLLFSARKVAWLINVKSHNMSAEQNSIAWVTVAKMVDDLLSLAETREE